MQGFGAFVGVLGHRVEGPGLYGLGWQTSGSWLVGAASYNKPTGPKYLYNIVESRVVVA